MMTEMTEGRPIGEDLAGRPKVSIVLPAYNAAETIQECVESILRQSFNDWELIICDDGSSDSTRDILSSYCASDARITVITNAHNRGLTFSLNRMLLIARGEYIARQDADDRSRPERLERQVAFLDANPEIAFVSSAMAMFDHLGLWGEVKNVERPGRLDFVWKSPFAHAPSMFRASAFSAVGRYRDLRRTRRVEDYDLWFRLYEAGFRGVNLPELLYEVRDDRDAGARRRFRYRINESIVKFGGYWRLRVPFRFYPFALRPILVGLVPKNVYLCVRRRKYETARR